MFQTFGGAEGATAPGISQATGPRAPDSLESALLSLERRRAAEGAKLSGAATDGGRAKGLTARTPTVAEAIE
jgi:hypothetical protein